MIPHVMIFFSQLSIFFFFFFNQKQRKRHPNVSPNRNKRREKKEEEERCIGNPTVDRNKAYFNLEKGSVASERWRLGDFRRGNLGTEMQDFVRQERKRCE
jgi:hypothetical protein